MNIFEYFYKLFIRIIYDFLYLIITLLCILLIKYKNNNLIFI